MRQLRKITALLFAFLLMICALGACTQKPEETSTEEVTTTETESETETEAPRAEDIVILYTNDIHTGINENLGFAGLASYKKEMLAETPYVLLVDNGDSVQGNYVCASSRGTSMMEAMNRLGYDYCVLGNHEFDYQLDGLRTMMEMANAQYLNCNMTYSGKGVSPFKDMKAYEIRDFGGTKVAFVGATTPDTVQSTTPKYFIENGETVVDFSRGGEGFLLYNAIQTAVDAARAEGAEIVVLMAHLGIADKDAEYRSSEVIAHTTGIDVVLDGHSHSVIPSKEYKNAKGEAVILTSTGTRMQSFGKLTIDPEGKITTELISDYEKKDEEIQAWITDIENVYAGFLGEPKFTLAEEMSIKDEAGIRIVRSRETGIGNFVADAYREAMGADIGMCNGGGIRETLPQGEVSELDLINVNPFGNKLCMIEVTGREILDMMELFYSQCASEYKKDGVAVGEFGSFQQLSGIKCVVDTSVTPDIVLDSEDNLVSVGTRRRVSEVQVLENGEYVPIKPEKTYTLAANDYMAKNGGCGMISFLADHKLLVEDAIADYEALLNYATNTLDGDLSRYYTTEGRIVIK